MPKVKIPLTYRPLPKQRAFHESRAVIRGYGGAMAGGKSRALCEDVFDAALANPGLQALICRERHVSITETTRRTMMTEVLPPELLGYCRIKQSGGEDFIRFPNESTIHFIGLDDPVKWFSSEIGYLVFDEAHEIPEDSVVKLITRLRQRDMPRRIVLGFNPENPGHWLYQWFIEDAAKTDYGYRKSALYPSEAVRPIGDAEFFFAKASDNPYLPEGYVDQNLAGLPDLLRQRYLEGEWLFTSGICYFDQEALAGYEVAEPLYRFDFRSRAGGSEAGFHRHGDGKIRVYEEPDSQASYAIGADVATGRGQDFSAAYVTRLDEPRLVCEFRGRLDQDLFAEQLHFLGRWYSDALLAVETGGGFGDAVIVPLRDGRGGRPPYPRLYRHILSTRPDVPMAKPYGYPMNVKTRALVLSQLEKHIRERSFPWLPRLLRDECSTFVHMDTMPSPRAQEGCHDDAVMAGAITMEMYRLRGHHPDREARRPEPRRRPRVSYPWQRRRVLAGLSAAEIEKRYPKGT